MPAQKGLGNKWRKQGKALKSNHDTRDRTLSPAGTVLGNRPNTNSIVGADISLYSIVGAMNSHTVRPPTCLWASTVLWASGFTIPSAHGETPHMPLGINSICRYRHLPYPNKTTDLPCASDIQQCCGRLPSSCTRPHGRQDLAANILLPSQL